MKKVYKILIFIFLINILLIVNVQAASSDEFVFCNNDTKTAFRMAGYAIVTLKIVVPLIIIVKSIMDLCTVVISGEGKDMSGSISNFIKRLIAGAVIFFIPTILNVMLSLIPVGENGITNSNGEVESQFAACHNCLLDPNGSCTIE